MFEIFIVLILLGLFGNAVIRGIDVLFIVIEHLFNKINNYLDEKDQK